jgi:hypothetical protein
MDGGVHPRFRHDVVEGLSCGICTNSLLSSFPRKWEPSSDRSHWVPAFAGMTKLFALGAIT